MDIAAKHLPTHMMPLLIGTGTQLPLTTNNKINKIQLRALILSEATQHHTLSLEQLWKRYTGHDPNMHSNFINDGGDSFSAVLIAETLGYTNLVDILLRKSFKDAIDNLKTKPIEMLNSNLDLLKDDGTTAKHSKINMNEATVVNDSESTLFDLVWKQDMLKCIDASPIVIHERVIIGSHKGIFACFDLISGKEQWKLQLGDRIEATAAAASDIQPHFLRNQEDPPNHHPGIFHH